MKPLFTFLLCTFGYALMGQSNYPADFTPHGPGGGGYMYSPSISPHNPDLMFLVCDMGGVYRSTDAGQHWQLLPSQEMVSSVKGKIQFTANPTVVYAVGRSLSNTEDPLFRGAIMKSTDAGLTWEAFADPTSSGVHRLEVDPTSTQRMLLNEYNKLFFTNNGGATWEVVFAPSDEQMWLGGVFWAGSEVFVGTDKGLLVSHDGGQSFALETHPGLPENTGILHLSGAKSGTVLRLFAIAAPKENMYAWAEQQDFRGELQGVFQMNYTPSAVWADSRHNIPDNVTIAWVDMPLSNPEIVWAAAAVDNALPAIYKSTDGGQSWENTFLPLDNQNISTGWGGDYGAYSYLWSGAGLGFDVSDTAPNRVIVTDGYGHTTTDGGQSWRANYVLPDWQNPIGTPTSVTANYRSSGLDVTTTHQLFWLNGQEMYAANTDISLTYSADAGQSWTFARNLFYSWGNVANPNWYRIVQRTDNQQLFAAVAELNDMYMGGRITDEQVNGTGLVATSTNQGITWDTLYNFGHPVVWIELDKSIPNRLYASVVHATEGGIFRSDDSGISWTKLNLPTRTEGHPYNIVSLNDGGLVVTFSARAQDDGVTLTESSGVFYSPDGGNTWVDRTAPAMLMYTKDVIVDPHDPTQQTWYATVWGRFTVWPGPNNAENGGLYKTTDRGLNWTRILANERAESVTIHPQNPEVAYLTAENDGLFFTENLNSPSPAFVRVTTFPFWRPKRVFFHPNNSLDVWVTTMGGGLWKGSTVSGAHEPSKIATLSLFPNPANARTGKVWADTRRFEQQSAIVRILNMSGELVRETLFPSMAAQTPIDFSGVPSGSYSVQMVQNGVPVAAGQLLIVNQY